MEGPAARAIGRFWAVVVPVPVEAMGRDRNGVGLCVGGSSGVGNLELGLGDR